MQYVKFPVLDYHRRVHTKSMYPGRNFDRKLFPNEVLFEEWIALVSTLQMPRDVSTKPNPRNQDISRSFYKPLIESNLSATDPTFCLKNKGIRCLASSIEKVGSGLKVGFDKNDGQVDGSHTYQIITQHAEGAARSGAAQTVEIRFIVGIPSFHHEVEIAKALNRGELVADHSILDKEGAFDWIKTLIKNEPWAKKVSYRQNDGGSIPVINLIRINTLFDVVRFPKVNEPPIFVYHRSKGMVKFYDKNLSQYKERYNSSFFVETLKLSDFIEDQGLRLLREHRKGMKKILTYEQSEKSTFSYPFRGVSLPYRMHTTILYPILAGFRAMVEVGSDGKLKWKTSLNDTGAFFQGIGGELIASCEDALRPSKTVEVPPDVLAKDPRHWQNVHKTVSLAYDQRRMTARTEAPVAVKSNTAYHAGVYSPKYAN